MILHALIVLIATYVLINILRVGSAILKIKVPHICPFCYATIATWLTGLFLNWDPTIVALFMGVTIFEYAVRIKAYYKSQNHKYYDYIKQLSAFVGILLALGLLALLGKI